MLFNHTVLQMPHATEKEAGLNKLGMPSQKAGGELE